MSVLKRKRTISSMEFISKARELEIYTIKKVSNFPEKYVCLLSQKTVNLACEILENAKLGNSIYPRNAHEVQLRIDYFLISRAKAYALISQIEACNEIFDIKSTSLRFWMKMIDEYLKLIDGVIKRDRKRFKNII